jgi:hypothetical protein
MRRGRKPVMKIALVVALVLGVLALSGARRATDWGSTYADFTAACAELGGVLNGTAYRATCSFEGGVTTVPAAYPGWTVDVAQGTVATLFGNVTEKSSGGTIVVACHDERGERMPVGNEGCVRQ